MNRLQREWAYVKYIVRHKYFVFRAGRMTKAPVWRLIVHDWSKFRYWTEWSPYREYFYNNNKGGDHGQYNFDNAWLAHIHKNKHHWQYWVLKHDSGTTEPLPIPTKYIKEMVADWYGAGRAITGKWEAHSWYEKNKHKMVLNEWTRFAVEQLLYSCEQKLKRSKCSR